jgi:hypothetical protein
MKWTAQDTAGFLVTAVMTTSPLFAVTWYGDHLSKDGPVGGPIYILPAAVGLGVAAAAALFVWRGWQDTPRRLGTHAAFGCLTAFALLVSFCVWWGDWVFHVGSRFRG